jgi:hypothetical protein
VREQDVEVGVADRPVAVEISDQRVVLPVIDQQLIVHPEPNAVVGFGLERVGVSTGRAVDPPAPRRREPAPRDFDRRRVLAPVEVDLRIHPRQAAVVERRVTEILAEQPADGFERHVVDHRSARAVL